MKKKGGKEEPRGIAALWAEIDAWFEAHGAWRNLEARRPGATAAQIARLEKRLGVRLSGSYVESLKVHDGGGSVESYEYLSTEEVYRWWRTWTSALEKGELEGRTPSEEGQAALQPGFWNRRWIPFAADSVGNLLCVDLDPGPRGKVGQLVQFERQDGIGPIAMPKQDFAGWLRMYRDRLRKGELVVDEDGFVNEPLIKPSVTPVDEAPKELSSKLSDRVEAAIRKGDLKKFIGVLDEHGLSANAHLIYERPLLCVAAEACNLEMVKLLLERGADINIGQRRGERTPRDTPRLNWAGRARSWQRCSGRSREFLESLTWLQAEGRCWVQWLQGRRRLVQSTNGMTQVQWGESTYNPAAADYNGDGKVDIAVWRPSTVIWYVHP